MSMPGYNRLAYGIYSTVNPHTRMLNTRFTNTSGTTVNHTMPIVILKTRKGLSREQKRRIVSEFTKTLVSTTGITPELVTILIEEHELEDIGKAGKLRCD
jgi:4-oxalocrotonate tautomerase family enzyme